MKKFLFFVAIFAIVLTSCTSTKIEETETTTVTQPSVDTTKSVQTETVTH